MYTPYDFCPKCHGPRRTNCYLGMQTITSLQGKDNVLLYCYYCDSCNTFIRSTPVQEKKTSKIDVPALVHH